MQICWTETVNVYIDLVPSLRICGTVPTFPCTRYVRRILDLLWQFELWREEAWEGWSRKCVESTKKKKIYGSERSQEVPARPSGKKYDGDKVEQWELERGTVIIGQKEKNSLSISADLMYIGPCIILIVE